MCLQVLHELKESLERAAGERQRIWPEQLAAVTASPNPQVLMLRTLNPYQCQKSQGSHSCHAVGSAW